MPTTSGKARYLEWFWSDKLGYVLAENRLSTRYIAENVMDLYRRAACRILFSEVSMDVLQMTGNDHTSNRPPILWNWPR